MIPMKAPPNVLSLSISGTQYPVVDGVIQVQPAHVKHALMHKFRLLDGMNADELIESDLELALAKAQAAIPVRGLMAKNGMKSMSIEGVSYVVGDDGYVEVPENMVPVALLLGCQKEVPLRPRSPALEQSQAGKSEEAGTLASPGSETPAVPTQEALKAMTDPELRAYLKSVGIEFLSDAKRKDMDRAARDWLDKAKKD